MKYKIMHQLLHVSHKYRNNRSVHYILVAGQMGEQQYNNLLKVSIR